MEYNINLPANLKLKSQTMETKREKQNVRVNFMHSQITNSKKLKMYRKSKWNWDADTLNS